MPRVIVDGYKPFNFPDDMSQEDMKGAIDKYISENETKTSERYSGPTGQFVKIWDIANQQATEGSERVQKAVEEPTGGNIINGVLGAMQYMVSPITAIGKGVFRDPVEIASKAVGAPEGVTNFLGEMAESVDILLPYGSLVKTAMATKKTVEGAKMFDEAVKTIKLGNDIKKIISAKTTGKPLEFPENMPEGLISEVQKRIDGTGKKIMAEEFTDDLIDAVKDKVGPKWNPADKKITQEVADYLMSDPKEIDSFIKRYPGYTPDKFAAELLETMKTSGRQLSIMGKWAKQLKKSMKTPTMNKITSYLEKEIPESYTTDRVMVAWRAIENVRRGLLVGQVATTMRNIISQGGRLGLGAIDDAFQGAVKGFVQGEGAVDSIMSSLRGMGEGLDVISATLSRLSSKDRKLLENILDTDNAIKAKSVMKGAPVHEVALGNKIARIANTLNTTQEMFFRNIAFEAKLNQILKSSGIKGGIKGLNPADIPEEALKQAAEYSLEMTFAAMPKSAAGKEIVKIGTHPIFTSLINPFPRFMFGNALPFLKEFSPVGFLDALDPKVVADLASGNVDKFAKSASRATIGTILLGTANYIRNSDMAGEKWYEVKSGDKSYDLRAFAPLSTYLFVAEAMSKPENIKPGDIFSSIFSLNRVAGTGLVISDIIRGKKAETVMNVVERIGGEYLGSFSTPLRTIKDLYSAIDPNEAVIRDIRESEFLGPTLRNIPEVSQVLPEAKSPLKTEPLKTESPVLRQFTGISYRVKTAIESELDNINFDKGMVYPKTGIPSADRKVSEVMAPVVEQAANNILNLKGYQNLDAQTKRVIWWSIFKEIKSKAMDDVSKTNPSVALKVKIERTPSIIKDLLKSKGIDLNELTKGNDNE